LTRRRPTGRAEQDAWTRAGIAAHATTTAGELRAHPCGFPGKPWRREPAATTALTAAPQRKPPPGRKIKYPWETGFFGEIRDGEHPVVALLWMLAFGSTEFAG
jgi:hypothetical protein